MSTAITNVKSDESLKKIVARRLPPTLSKDQFLETVAPLPEHDYFCYCKADLSLGQYAYCRAYISFLNSDDVYIFKEKFDNYVFVDSKSNEYPALVEFAPYQRKLRNNLNSNELKKDSKCNTIDQDPEYVKFLENLDKPDGEQLPSCEIILEQIEQKEKDMQISGGTGKLSTPLLDYLRKKREDRRLAQNKERELRKKRDEERRRRREEETQRRKDDDERRSSYSRSSYQKTAANTSAKSSQSTTNASRNANSGASVATTKTATTAASAKTASHSATKQTAAKPDASKDTTLALTSNEDAQPQVAAVMAAKSSEQSATIEISEKEQQKKDRIRNKDRPSIEIYNPAQRAAQRRQQQTTKD